MATTGSFQAMFTTSPTLFFSISVAVLLALYTLIHTYLRGPPPNAPKPVQGNYPITGAFGFWTKRWDFYRNAARRSPTGNFTFHVGPHTVVALSGEKGRKTFFENKKLGFSEGYAVLFGQSPKVEEKLDENDSKIDPQDTGGFYSRRLHHLLQNSEFRRKLPALLSDVDESIEMLQNDPSGITDPFESIYRVVYRLTLDMVGADEICQDAKLREMTLQLYETIEQSATATTIMFPHVPSLGILKRTYAGGKLYMIFKDIISKRNATGEKHDDALQYLMENGDSTMKIIEFMLGSLFAGQLNSGINAAWVLCYLAKDSYWRGRVLEEIRAVTAKYSKNPNLSLRAQLADIPIEAWESEFSSVDICLRESIRLSLVGTAFRKNVSRQEIPIIGTGEVIPPNAFVTYATADVHLNPKFYPDPEKWDPTRYLPGRAEDKREHGYLGWGTGRHPCLGVRFAKLEQNIITAYFVAAFEFDLTDKSGRPLPEVPKVDFNAYSASKPNHPMYLRYHLREK